MVLYYNQCVSHPAFSYIMWSTQSPQLNNKFNLLDFMMSLLSKIMDSNYTFTDRLPYSQFQFTTYFTSMNLTATG